MAKPRKTEIPEEVLKWINPDMDEETMSGKGYDEDIEASPEGIGIGGFTNSPLVTYTKLSPFKNSPRNQPITKIIIHHMAGVASVESFGEIVTAPGREMSANYAIGNDGRIGLYCPEEDRCWCSSSAWVDNRGIAIEVSNSKLGEPWPISKEAWDSMINLCADICKRNNIPKLVYTGDKDGSLCFHRWFAATGCVPIDTSEVLTPNGWVPVRDIRLGDMIAVASPKDFTIHFDKVENMTPVHKDTVFTLGGISITSEHRVLHSSNGNGYRFEEFHKICDAPFTVPTAGRYEPTQQLGIPISSSEMVFLIETQRVGIVEDGHVEFRYISESQVGYMDGLLKNLKFKHERIHDDLGPVRFVVSDARALELVTTYLSGKDFNWKWLDMNPTQFQYFIYKITCHHETGWTRQYKNDSIVNINIVQALCALNEKGSEYDPNTKTLYVKEGFRTVNNREVTTADDVEVACVTVKTGCFLLRQHGVTTLTGNCPGEYIFSRAQQICDEVNAKLAELPEPTHEPDPDPTPVSIKPGVLVSLKSGATYYGGGKIPDWVMKQRWYVTSISGDRVVLGKNEAGNSDINSPVSSANLTVIQNASVQPETKFSPYLVKLAAGTNIYDIKTRNLKGQITISTAYTIVEETVLDGVKYGRLKSGAGWVRLENDKSSPVDNTIKPGDKVSVKHDSMNHCGTYEGGTFYVYEDEYTVLRVNGDRVVISSDGKNVTAAVKALDLIKK